MEDHRSVEEMVRLVIEEQSRERRRRRRRRRQVAVSMLRAAAVLAVAVAVIAAVMEVNRPASPWTRLVVAVVTAVGFLVTLRGGPRR